MNSENERFWNGLSPSEEVDLDDEKINRILRWKALEPLLQGVKTILDIGAGTGAFSIPLAEQGFEVTHLDISDAMLQCTQDKARGLRTIQFLKRDAADLCCFKDNTFDLVISFDGAISFSGHNANRVIAEACRVGEKLILSVSNKSCMAATWLNYSLSKLNRIHPSVITMMESGYFNKADYDDAEELTSIAELKAFSPEELTKILEQNNMLVKECRSIGSLTHLYLLHLYRQGDQSTTGSMLNSLAEQSDFIDLCDTFDRELMPRGMGSFRRAGLLAVAEKRA